MSTEEFVEERLTFASEENRDAFARLVAELGENRAIQAPSEPPQVKVVEVGTYRPPLGPDTRGIGVVTFFIVIAGTAFIIKVVRELVETLRQEGGAVIDLRGDKPVISNDPNLPDDSILIIAKDGTVELKVEQSAFQTLMEILKALLLKILGGKADSAEEIGDAVKDASSDGGNVEVNVSKDA